VSAGEVRLERDGHVATITISRPEKLNAVTIEMARALYPLVEEINLDDDLRVVVLTGAGERAFSAGSDVNMLDAYGTPWELRRRAAARQDYIDAVWSIRKPVIAAVRGYAYGGGLELCMACDIRVAARTASFAASEVRRGWHAGSGQTQLLPRLVGPGKAAQMLLTGDPIDAEEAHRVGLVDELADDADVLPRARAIADRIAANPPIAVQLGKHLVRMSQNTTLQAGWAFENDLHVLCMTTEDAREGMSAFREKREPHYRGR
jgi:enoyl-CoA hydratase